MWSSPAAAQTTTAPATAPAGAAPGGIQTAVLQFAPLLFIFVIFYVLIIRPQQKRLKAHKETIGAVKRGDEVVTAGGLVGRVLKVADDELELELGQNVRVRAVRSTIAEVRSRGVAQPANDAKG